MQKGSFRHWEAMTFSGGFHPENPRGSGEAKSPARYGAGTQKSVCYIPCATPLCYKPNLALGFSSLATLPLLNIVLLLFHRSKTPKWPTPLSKKHAFCRWKVDESSSDPCYNDFIYPSTFAKWGSWISSSWLKKSQSMIYFINDTEAVLIIDLRNCFHVNR